MALRDWVKLPSGWIEAKGLQQLHWGANGEGSANTAALMVLAAIAHHTDNESGIARLTYNALGPITGLSRAKVSAGLDVLQNHEVIERTPVGRSSFRLANYDPAGGWVMLPAKRLYAGERIAPFDNFHLRSLHELNALKLYFLFASRRGRDTNMANISLDKITEYSGVERARIKPATSFLSASGLVYVEHTPSTKNEDRIANGYRLVGLYPKMHMGTRGQGMDAVDFQEF
ncbi:hypothetical protein ACQKQD_33685 [Methylobacterium sp. NPDC080182]|uniref:hypothetical protein n=1 Tax=Methylobacterium sp. NPDC080182 TaxID=3390590 RepID=UPI003D03B562